MGRTVIHHGCWEVGQPTASDGKPRAGQVRRASQTDIGGPPRFHLPCRKNAGKLGIACEGVHVREKFVSDGILEIAKEHECDLIVMASHGRRGFSRFFLGSQTDQVLVQTDIAVLVVR